MESSQMFGGTEECHSSESGWTMYIGSPIYGDDDDDSDNGTHDDEDHDGDDGDDDDDDDDDGNQDDDSDDSMASDASSGPSHSLAVFKHEEEENGNRHRLEKKSDKQKHKAKVQIRAQTINEEKEDQTVFMARKANNIASAQSGAIAKLMSRKTATHSTYDFRSRNTNVGRHEQIKSSPICQYARANSPSY
ncbi:rRNA biogenesis protein rrp36-like [Juglans regia]|uniref:rRNA biogenesis protein rrp36-like n=1 Tax=Juglans regia TaxID=51240 RepID=A0A6P9E2G5_JUGRE|nr:rRNA biogenesis protein rrp36-like [Juglans regia]